MKKTVDLLSMPELFKRTIRPLFTGIIGNSEIDNIADNLALRMQKYTIYECTYIGDWLNENYFLVGISAILSSKLSQYQKYFYDLSLKTMFDRGIPRKRTENETTDTQNDTFSTGENSPINADDVIPDLKAGATGLRTPSNKARGRYVANSDKEVSFSSPEYHKAVIDTLNNNPNFLEIFDSVFQTVLEEYTKLY